VLVCIYCGKPVSLEQAQERQCPHCHKVTVIMCRPVKIPAK